MIGISYFLLLISTGIMIIDIFMYPVGVISDNTLFQCTVICTVGLVLGVIASKYNRRV